MALDVHGWVIDEEARKATICWVCRHDIEGDRGRGVFPALRLAYRLFLGQRAGWHGLDVFHLDGAGKIVGKHSYTNGRPKLQRALGSPRPASR